MPSLGSHPAFCNGILSNFHLLIFYSKVYFFILLSDYSTSDWAGTRTGADDSTDTSISVGDCTGAIFLIPLREWCALWAITHPRPGQKVISILQSKLEQSVTFDE